MVAADLQMLAVLDQQVADAEEHLAVLLPSSPFAVLTSVPGWALVRASAYGAAVGDPSRWPGPRQIYRASGLSPMQYESAGKRRDGAISREGSVELRRALIDLGVGLWLNEPAAKAYAAGLRSRGKKGGVIACALANRANRIAYALVRDQQPYDPTRWTLPVPAEPGGMSPKPSSVSPAIGCTLVGDEGPDQTPYAAMADPSRVTPLLAWRPALRPCLQLERRQMTHPPLGEVAYVSVSAPATVANQAQHPTYAEPNSDDNAAGSDSRAPHHP